MRQMGICLFFEEKSIQQGKAIKTKVCGWTKKYKYRQ